MNKKWKILPLLLVGMFSFTTALSSCKGSNNGPVETINPTNLFITLDGSNDVLEKAKVEEGSTLKLVPHYEPESLTLTFDWVVANPQIATVNDGLITALKSGLTTLTITCKEYPNLSKIIFLEVTDKVAQKGVGSGTSAEDPIFIGNEGSQEPLEIFFIEVQKMYADAIYIRKGNVDCLIDAGQYEDGPHVKEFLKSHMRDKTLDMVMVSHTHADHYGGMSTALEAVDNVSLFVDYGGDSKNSYQAARDSFIAKGSSYYSAYDCVNYNNGAVKDWYLTKDLKFTVLDTGNYIKDTGSAQNPESVTALFTYKDFTYYTAGDLTTEAERSLIQRENLSQVSLYKASHHGSHGSNSSEILDILDPYMAGISAAITGDTPSSQLGVSGHPAAAAVERMYKAPRLSQNLNIYWNGVNGDMCFKTFGGKTDIEFSGSPTIKGYYEQDASGAYKKVTGEENLKFHESKVFKARGYQKYLPDWAKAEFGYTE